MPLAPGDDAVAYTSFSLATARGVALRSHRWAPKSTDGGGFKAVVYFVHGYASHGLFPTVVSAALQLAGRGYLCFALDLEGHGGSEGVRGLILDEGVIIADWKEFLEATGKEEGAQGRNRFLFGTSMGGAIALAIAAAIPDLSGAVLSAPMCGLKPEAIPPAWQIPLLKAVAWFAPSLAVISSSASDNSAQYKDPEMRALIDQDELSYKGKVRLGTGYFILNTLNKFGGGGLEKVSIPFIVVHGDADVIVDHTMSEELHRKAASTDKEIHIIKGGLHGLACETEPTRSEVQGYINSW
eukprot:CAMPEP_0182852356 /NCGR_PEP_ID=MMETSP0034_2-20130328/122_1 /TAXON_ID=156128 /ORGANISM="Nephroselmis pyriformis, Strain CCMP717" /LENGTH=296 /DNA_ID=CAMNT_0024983061 /DNA_START=72 /DNA_END=959 /DNA_ORIENTATION=+